MEKERGREEEKGEERDGGMYMNDLRKPNISASRKSLAAGTDLVDSCMLAGGALKTW